MKYKNKKVNNYRYKQLMKAKERQERALVEFFPSMSPQAYKLLTDRNNREKIIRGE